MSDPGWPAVPLRHERHFGDRVLRCFSERPPHLNAMLAAAHAQAAQAEALVDGDRRWTWGELRDQSTRLALGLRRAGVVPGDRVVLLAPNHAEFVIATHAVLRLGAVLVPVSMREAGPGIAFILNQCRAALVIADPVMTMLVPPALNDGQPLQRVALGAGSGEGWLRWDTLLDQDPAAFTDAQPQEDDAAVILYTSGTTGAPKGAVLTQLNLVHSVLHYRHALGLRSGERGLLAVPASHVTGLVALVLAMAGVGGCVVLLAEFKAAASLALVARERVSYTLMVPAMYALWLREESLQRTDLSSLRLAGFGGAPMAPATIEGA